MPTEYWDDAEVRAALKLVREVKMPNALKEALRKVGFEMASAEADETERVFHPSARGRTLFSKGFRPTRVTQTGDEYEVIVHAKRATDKVLKYHVPGLDVAYTAATVKKLEYHSSLAIPVDVQRDASTGKVKARMKPSKILAQGRGYISPDGRRLYVRVGRGKAGAIKLAYSLVQHARNKPRFKFFEVAARTAGREFPKKVRYVVQKFLRQE